MLTIFIIALQKTEGTDPRGHHMVSDASCVAIVTATKPLMRNVFIDFLKLKKFSLKCSW